MVLLQNLHSLVSTFLQFSNLQECFRVLVCLYVNYQQNRTSSSYLAWNHVFSRVEKFDTFVVSLVHWHSATRYWR